MVEVDLNKNDAKVGLPIQINWPSSTYHGWKGKIVSIEGNFGEFLPTHYPQSNHNSIRFNLICFEQIVLN